MSDYEKLLNEAVDHIRALTGSGTPLDKCGECWHCGGGMECRPGCPHVKARAFLARDEIAGRCAELSA